MRDATIAIYTRAREIAEKKGIIIADTKLEFGVEGDSIMLIDEVLTPDSSRFWPADGYQPGKTPESFDKQFVRLSHQSSLGHAVSAAGPAAGNSPENPRKIHRGAQETYK
jgi:phosphoribosylaminoimidazole-succinocarboxamide synthase